MKLLVIDSDRDLVEMLTSWLKTLGYEVYRAYNSERARSEWLEQRPDLVIIDPMLKGGMCWKCVAIYALSTMHWCWC